MRNFSRMIDLRLMPILGLVYSLSLVDRANVSNARVRISLFNRDSLFHFISR